MKPSLQGFFRPTWGKTLLTLIYLFIIYIGSSFLMSYFGLDLADMCIPILSGIEPQGNPIDFDLSDNLDISYAIQNIFRVYCPGVRIRFVIYIFRFLLYLLIIFVAYTLACITASLIRKPNSYKKQTK